LLDNLVESDKGSSADKEYIGSIDLDKLLMGMLATALRRHIGQGAFDHFEQSLLYTLAGYIASDACVL